DKSKSICYTDKKHINRGANAMISTARDLCGVGKGHLPRVWAFPKGARSGAARISTRLSPKRVLCYLIHVAVTVFNSRGYFFCLENSVFEKTPYTSLLPRKRLDVRQVRLRLACIVAPRLRNFFFDSELPYALENAAGGEPYKICFPIAIKYIL
ncbi:MAG: hypothetical protein IIX69_08105, partial [Clostridia bacterium]|nr:hypothetical protein [Clostridia bacterium]